MSENGNEAFGYNRRDFLKSGSFATLMSMMGGVELFAQSTPAPAPDSEPILPKIKVGVIGLGAWGRKVLEALTTLKQADIAAISDMYGAYLRRSAKLAPSAKPIEDYRAIINDKEIKAVIVATPTHKHKEVVLAALQAGKHVYCEAPMAGTIEDAREIALAAKAAKKQVFQVGLQMRSDPQRLFLLPFIRTGALGKWIMARAQSHKKQSWRTSSENAEQDKALNWRLSKATSTGLVGEIGIHAIDQASWFLNAHPISVTGFSSMIKWQDTVDVGDVPNTIQAVFEFPRGVRLMYDCTLANSFDSDYELYYGSDAAVMMRAKRAWMFKETDSPLLSWEVYAKKEEFFKEAGIVLMLGSSKQQNMDEKPKTEVPYMIDTLASALTNFLRNAVTLSGEEEDYIATVGANDPNGLVEHLAKVPRQPAAGYLEGFQAVVTAIKANEAILSNSRLAFKPEWYELA